MISSAARFMTAATPRCGAGALMSAWIALCALSEATICAVIEVVPVSRARGLAQAASSSSNS
jgi:hypothetical protein